MNQFFIKYRPYKGLDLLERLLMSWIVGLHENRKTICFSNQYASKMLDTSDRTIRSKVASLVEKGYIKYHLYGKRRFIQVVRIPEIDIFLEDICELEENTSTQVGNDFHDKEEITSTMEENKTIKEENISDRVVNISTYKIVDKIEDKLVSESAHTHPLYPKSFLELVEKYKDKNDKLEYTYQRWTELNPTERQVAFDSVETYFLYLSRTGKVKKHLQYYLQDKVFNWDGLDKMKQTKNKPTPKKMTDAEKAAMGLELIKQHIQK